MGEDILQMIYPIRGQYPEYIKTHITQHPKKKKKKGRGPEQTFFQRIHADGQQVHEKMHNITNLRGNANKNYNKISPYTCQNGYYQKDNK